MDKAHLRTELRQRIQTLRPLQRALEEELVNAALLGEPAWTSAHTVLVYHHKGAEFSVTSLANAAFRDGKRVVFPRVDGDRLALHAVADWTDLGPGAFGLQEPRDDAPAMAPADVDVAVVPGLGWTRAGDRLGQGGGFYDRLLLDLTCPTFGVGFDCQLLEVLPVEAHDVRVGRVVTADRVV